MKVCVVGTGYVGLTTGVSLAFLGHEVTCVDLDQNKVDMLRAGKCPIYEPGMEDLLAEAAPNLSFTTSYDEGVPGADVVFVAVQTVYKRQERRPVAGPRLHRRGEQVDRADRQRQLGGRDPARVVRSA